MLFHYQPMMNYLLAELLLLRALALLALELGAVVALFLVAPRPASRLLSKEGLPSGSTIN